MTDGSGRLFCDWCGKSSPCGCWRRTFQESLLSDLTGLTGYSLKWKRRVTSACHLLLVLGRSGRRTSGIGCGSSGDWQTPTAVVVLGGNICRGGKRKGELLLAGQVKAELWTTPQAHDAQGTPDAKRVGRYGTKHGGRNLPDDVAADWSTPIASDSLGEMHQSDKAVAAGFRARLQDQARAEQWPTPAASDGLRAEMSAEALISSVEKQRANRPKGAPAILAAEVQRAGRLAQANPSTRGKRRGSLSYEWVSQLMGLPRDWCAISEASLVGMMLAPKPGGAKTGSASRGGKTKRG